MMQGHDKQRKKLTRLLQEDKLAHALLFVGPPSVGKKIVARELAKKILCPDDSPSTVAFDANTHPDFYLLDGEEKPSVEDVRTMLTNLSLKPLMAASRVAIIDNADNLSLSVQNTLLKTLEEPRSKSYFFLISSNPSRLATTIRSRCQTWFFDELHTDALESVLHSLGKGLSKQQIESLMEKTVAQGLQLFEQTSDEANHSLAEDQPKFSQILQGDASLALSFAGSIAQDKEKGVDTLRQLLTIARNMLHASKDQATQYRLSLFISNSISGLELIEQRNLAILPVASMILLELAKPFSARQRKVNFGTLEVILS